LGNILLEDFDKELNGRGVTCIRYIDDFVVLGPDKHKVEAAFKSGMRILATHGLTAYDPKISTDKAGMGEIRHGFEFLGCNIRPGMISPARKSRRRIIEAVKAVLDKSLVMLDQPALLRRNDLTALDTLVSATNILEGWGNQYAFCNDREVLKQLDSEVNGLIENYWKAISRRYAKFMTDTNLVDSRRLLGVHLLIDSKFDPIITSR